MRTLIISLPLGVVVFVLWAFFCAVGIAARSIVQRRCGDEAQEDLAEQANNLMTGVAATFAFLIGFAISMSWGAVTAGQSAVERQSTAIQEAAWHLRNIPDPAASAALTDRLRAYAHTAAHDDPTFLARGQTTDLPSTPALEAFDDAVQSYVTSPAGKSDTTLTSSVSALASSSAAVAAVGSRSLPRPLGALLVVVGVVVTTMVGISTIARGRRTTVFIYVWCLIPAVSLGVVAALAFPFALRTGMPFASVRAVASQLGVP